MGESQGEQEPHLGKRRKSKREHGQERVDSAMKEDTFEGDEGEKQGEPLQDFFCCFLGFKCHFLNSCYNL